MGLPKILARNPHSHGFKPTDGGISKRSKKKDGMSFLESLRQRLFGRLSEFFTAGHAEKCDVKQPEVSSPRQPFQQVPEEDGNPTENTKPVLFTENLISPGKQDSYENSVSHGGLVPFGGSSGVDPEVVRKNTLTIQELHNNPFFRRCLERSDTLLSHSSLGTISTVENSTIPTPRKPPRTFYYAQPIDFEHCATDAQSVLGAEELSYDSCLSSVRLKLQFFEDQQKALTYPLSN